MHFAAGFGSQMAMFFIRRLDEKSASGNDIYRAWINRIAGVRNPEISVLNGALVVRGEIATNGAPTLQSGNLSAGSAQGDIKQMQTVSAPNVAAPVVSRQTQGDMSTAGLLDQIKKIIAEKTIE